MTEQHLAQRSSGHVAGRRECAQGARDRGRTLLMESLVFGARVLSSESESDELSLQYSSTKLDTEMLTLLLGCACQMEDTYEKSRTLPGRGSEPKDRKEVPL